MVDTGQGGAISRGGNTLAVQFVGPGAVGLAFILGSLILEDDDVVVGDEAIGAVEQIADILISVRIHVVWVKLFVGGLRQSLTLWAEK